MSKGAANVSVSYLLIACGVRLSLGNAAQESSLAGVLDKQTDSASLFQKPVFLPTPATKEAEQDDEGPHVIGLRRESVPIYRKGKIASFKTSYSGLLAVGNPPQEFRVVFDTGSGNIVLPAAECKSEACLVPDRRRFDMSSSRTAVAVQTDSRPVEEGEASDQVTIGFGTGEITGEFARDTVCFGVTAQDFKCDDELSSASVPGGHGPCDHGADGGHKDAGVHHNSTALVKHSDELVPPEDALCVEMSVILAVEMSTQPFKTFRFDGILGLGLEGLTMHETFSAVGMLINKGKVGKSHFGVYLTDGDEDDESEIAMGGVNDKRILEPLAFSPVIQADLGYWLIDIVAVRVNGKELDICKDGTCRGVVDTGTSHLGVPAPFDGELADMLTMEAGDTLDCRLALAPEVQIELKGGNISLHPFNYMRRLPLREGVSVSSAQGVYVPSEETNKTLGARSSADAPGMPTLNSTNATNGSEMRAENASGNGTSLVTGSLGNETHANGSTNGTAESEEAVRRFCRPRLLPVRMPAPLGPKLFILGEPVLHRYYTVYDWGNKQVGFSLANNKWNTMDHAQITDRKGSLPKEVDMLLMQKNVDTTSKLRVTGSNGRATPQSDESMFVQVKVNVRMSVRRVKRSRQ